MDFGSIPLALLLLLPGFLLLHLIFLVSRIRRISAFYATMWSLLGSLALVVISWPLYAVTISPPERLTNWPGLLDVLADSTKVPGLFWALLYAFSAILGIFLGFLDRKRIIDKALSLVGLDIRVHGDLWGRLLRAEDYSHLVIYLKDGSLVSGWPKYFSNDREPPGPEIYLSDFQVWDPESGSWKVQEGILGSLIHGNEISRIEFIAKDVSEDDDKDA